MSKNKIPQVGGLYVLRFEGTEHYYIGRTHNFRVRFQTHLNNLRAGNHPNIWVQHVFDKYGEETYRADVLSVIDDADERVHHEQILLDMHYKTQGCLNLSDCAKTQASFKGRVHSEETRQLLSDALKNREFTATHRAALVTSSTGRVLDAATRAKIGKKNAERVWTDESRAKTSASCKAAYAREEAKRQKRLLKSQG